MKKIFFLSAILFLLSALPVRAAGYGVSLNPPLLRVNIKPGKSITQVFTINNLTDDDKYLVARIVPFTESDNKGNPVIDLRSEAVWTSYFSLANSDIKLGDPFTVKGNSSEQIILNIAVPETALLRDLYATLLVSTYSNVVSLPYQGSLVNATIGSNILITVNPELNPATILKIEKIVPVSGSFFRLGNYFISDNITPITFSASISNTGDFAAETKGVFRVTTRKDVPLYLEGILPVNVISKSERILLNTDGKNFTFTPGLTQLGSYRFNFQINTDNSNTTSTVTVVFFPFKIGLGLLISLAIIASLNGYRTKTRILIDTSVD